MYILLMKRLRCLSWWLALVWIPDLEDLKQAAELDVEDLSEIEHYDWEGYGVLTSGEDCIGSGL